MENIYKKINLSLKEKDLLIDLLRVVDNAYVLFEKDEKKVAKWLITSNKRFYNFSPLNMILAGKAKSIYSFQEDLRYDIKENKNNFFKDKFSDKISPIITIFTMVCKLCENDYHKAATWMMEPNGRFGEISPLIYSLQGNENDVIEFLKVIS